MIVNRVWERHFGKGLVGSPSNFGQLGDKPTHPELLDTLAVRLMDHGWSLKWLHREIMTSATYQQRIPADRSADGDNLQDLSPVPRRMTAEQFVDAVWQLTESHPAKPDAAAKLLPALSDVRSAPPVYVALLQGELLASQGKAVDAVQKLAAAMPISAGR